MTRPLSIDLELVREGGLGLLDQAGNLPLAPPPFTPPGGTDPLSTAISGEVPLAEGPILAEMPTVKAGATDTATKVVSAADTYERTDEMLGRRIEARNRTGAATAENTASCQPRGKNDESVPNNRRRHPTTSKLCRKTSRRVRCAA